MSNIIGLGTNPSGGGGNVQNIKIYNITDNDILANSFSITPDTGYNSIQNITVNTTLLKKNFKLSYKSYTTGILLVPVFG